MPTSHKAVLLVAATLSLALGVTGAVLLAAGAVDNDLVLAAKESDPRTVAPGETLQPEPAAPAPSSVAKPDGTGRSVPGPDGWLTYTDPTQTWQLDVPAPLTRMNGGPDVMSLQAIEATMTYGVEWIDVPGAGDLQWAAEDVTTFVRDGLRARARVPVSELDTVFEWTAIGDASAVRFSSDLSVGDELLRHSGVVFFAGGDFVYAYVLDFGGDSPLEADRFLSSVRMLT